MPKFLALSLFGMILIPTLLAFEAKTEEKLDCGLGLSPEECDAYLNRMLSDCMENNDLFRETVDCLALEVIELQKQIGALKTTLDVQQPQIQALASRHDKTLKALKTQLEASLQNLKEDLQRQIGALETTVKAQKQTISLRHNTAQCSS